MTTTNKFPYNTRAKIHALLTHSLMWTKHKLQASEISNVGFLLPYQHQSNLQVSFFMKYALALTPNSSTSQNSRDSKKSTSQEKHTGATHLQKSHLILNNLFPVFECPYTVLVTSNKHQDHTDEALSFS